MFQSTVANNMGFGVVGELFLDGPLRAQPVRLNSADAANNVFGRAFTTTASGTASFATAADPTPVVAAAGGAATQAFAGILAFPKEHALIGNGLASSLALPNNTLATLVQETAGLIVTLSTAAAVGDWVWYATATGALQSTAPGASAPAGTVRVPNGRVTRYAVAAGGLAVIEFNAIA